MMLAVAWSSSDCSLSLSVIRTAEVNGRRPATTAKPRLTNRTETVRSDETETSGRDWTRATRGLTLEGANPPSMGSAEAIVAVRREIQTCRRTGDTSRT